MKETTKAEGTKLTTAELLTPEVVTELDAMIHKLAYKKKDTVMIDFEDLVNTLWVKALDVIEKKGEVDFNYIARACLFGIVDIVRQNVKSNSATQYSNEFFDQCITREQFQSASADHHEGNVYDYSSVSQNRFHRPEEKVELEDILNLFDSEDEEKERQYIKTWMDILGFNENIENPELLPNKAYDRFIAVEILHYAGSSSGGYAKLKNRVKAKLIANGYHL